MTQRRAEPMEKLAALFLPALEEGAKVTMRVVGNSMFPLLASGRDSVVLQKTDTFRKYDILFYRRDNGSYVLHRVVGKRKGDLLIAGDNETVRETVRRSQVVACAVAFRRKDRDFTCRSPLYRLYSILWVCVLPFRHNILSVLQKMQQRLHSFPRQSKR